jgi:hypothetical protein
MNVDDCAQAGQIVAFGWIAARQRTAGFSKPIASGDAFRILSRLLRNGLISLLVFVPNAFGLGLRFPWWPLALSLERDVEHRDHEWPDCARRQHADEYRSTDASAGEFRSTRGPYQRRQAADEGDRGHHHRAEAQFRAGQVPSATDLVDALRCESRGLGISPDRLRRLAEPPQESAAHPLAVREACFLGNGIHGETTLFHQHARGFDAQVLDGFRRRLAGLRSKRPAELARAQSRRVGKFFDGQSAFQVSARIDQSPLNAVRFGLEFKKSRKLRLAAGAAMVDDHLARNRAGGLLAEVLFHHRQGQIDARRNSRGRPDRAVDDEDAILLDLELRISGLQVTREPPMSGRPAAVKGTGFGECECAGAGSGDSPRREHASLYEREQARCRLLHMQASSDDHRVEGGIAERFGVDRETQRGIDGTPGLGEEDDLIHLLPFGEVCELEGADDGEPHRLKIRKHDEADVLHGRLDVLKGGLYDI